MDKDFLFFNVSLELLVSFIRCVENFYIYNKSDVRLFVLLNFDLYGDWMINIICILCYNIYFNISINKDCYVIVILYMIMGSVVLFEI